MSPKKKATGEEDKNKPREGKGGKKLLIVIAAVAVLAAAAAGVYFFLGPKDHVSAGARSASAKEKAKANQVVDFGDVVVNLADTGSSRYLRVKIVFEFPENKKLEEDLKKKNHQIKDLIISLLRTKTTADVYKPENVELIKKQILEKVNSCLENGQVENLFFTEYLVQ
ncbi:MAG: flagellar basal body-associated FliL family protein [Firmicutes bacterium]|nr:flagellar basal body-associated FliL family protein [Bacillota bacterium]